MKARESHKGLVLLTLGGPLPLYNGGLLLVSLFYFDADRNRPGLPPDVSALIERNERAHLTLALVNLNPARARRVIVQGGAFGEHRFGRVAAQGEPEGLNVQAARFLCELKPASMVTLQIEVARYALTPKYHSAM